MTDIASRLAADLLAAMGLACVHIERQVARDHHTKLTIAEIGVRSLPGEKVWFRNLREAKKVETAMLSRCSESSRAKNGLLIKLPVGEVADRVSMIARSLGITPIRDEDVATTFDSIHRRVDQAIVRMKRSGHLSMLNKTYRAERKHALENDIPCPPKFDIWLERRLETELSRFYDAPRSIPC